jgi:Reverse transcriptase (RNA-dependent DNA polymerase)/Integrase core domain
MGTIFVKSFVNNTIICLHNAILNENTNTNLISDLDLLQSTNWELKGYEDKYEFIVPGTNNVALTCHRVNRLLTVEMQICKSTDVDNVKVYAVEAIDWDWSTLHYTFGHMGNSNLRKFIVENTLDLKLPNLEPELFTCPCCAAGKFKKTPFNKDHIRIIKSNGPGEYLHTDISGKCEPTFERNGKKYNYFMVVVDDFSRFCWVRLLEYKDDAFTALQDVITLIETQLDAYVKRIKYDNGELQKSNEVRDYCVSKGILPDAHTSHQPETNGVAESAIRILKNIARPQLLNTNLPGSMWGTSIEHAADLRNIWPNSAIGNASPWERLHRIKPFAQHLRPFGCKVSVPLYAKALVEGAFTTLTTDKIYLGSHTHKMIYCVDPVSGLYSYHRYEDATFEVNVFPKYKAHKKSSFEVLDDVVLDRPSTSREERAMAREKAKAIHTSLARDNVSVKVPQNVLLDDNPGLIIQDTSMQTELHDVPLQGDTTNKSSESRERSLRKRKQVIYEEYSSDTDSDGSSVEGDQDESTNFIPELEREDSDSDESDTDKTNYARRVQAYNVTYKYVIKDLEKGMAMVDHTSTIIMNRMAKTPTERELNRFALAAIIQWDGVTPLTYQEAMASKDSDRWAQAIKEEYENLNRHQTWDVLNESELPAGAKPIGCKWVFKVKLNPDGSVERYKARLVAQGFSQRWGIDYDETYAPVLQISTLRWLIALGVFESLMIDMMDITGAYLNGKLKEVIYMRTPPGFEYSGKVLRLNMSLYGLKQAGRTWYEKISEHLFSKDFKTATGDKCLFYKHSQNGIICVGVYVDDLIIVGRESEVINFKREILEVFDARDLGKICYCLGVQYVHFDNGDIFMYQQKYIKEMLKRFKMENANPIRTPMEKRSMTFSSDQLGPTKENEPKLKCDIPYSELIGCLMYLTNCTRPDIAVSVNLLARYLTNPCMRHWIAAKRILKYLKHTEDMGLLFTKKDGNFDIVTYSDAAESDIEKSLAQTGVLSVVGGNTVYYQSTKQSVPHSAITDAENYACLEAMKQTLALADLHDDIGVQVNRPIPIYIDSMGVLDRLKTGRVTRENKHLVKRFNVLRHEQQVGNVKYHHVVGTDNPSDALTKSLTGVPFVRHRKSYNLQYLRVLRGDASEESIDRLPVVASTAKHAKFDV